jgi:hypothetical protein
VRSTFEDIFTYSAPQRFSDTWFRKVFLAGRAVMALEVSSHAVDPTAYGANASLYLWVPSPDGKLVVVGIDADGSMAYRVIDVADGKVARDLGSPIGFYHGKASMKTGVEGQVAPETQIWWRPIEGEAEHQLLEIDPAIACPSLQRTVDGRPFPRTGRRRVRGGSVVSAAANGRGPCRTPLPCTKAHSSGTNTGRSRTTRPGAVGSSSFHSTAPGIDRPGASFSPRRRNA